MNNGSVNTHILIFFFYSNMFDVHIRKINSFTISKGASSNPATESVVNFLTPKTIVVTSEKGVAKTWTIIVSYPTGAEDLNDAELLVYPNPTSDFINISGINSGANITLINGKGEIILSLKSKETNLRIDLRQLSTGMYFLKVDSGKSQSVKKIIRN